MTRDSLTRCEALLELVGRRLEDAGGSYVDAQDWATAVLAALEPEYEVVPASALEGAVSLLDELADVLAEVSRHELAPDDARVRDALHRAALHTNGVQS